jgi:hypothetical protein
MKHVSVLVPRGAVALSCIQAFRMIFSRIAGISPMSYRHRYNREVG